MPYSFDGRKNDIVKHTLLTFFSPKKLSIAALVCKEWSIIADDEQYWQKKLQKLKEWTNYTKEHESSKETYRRIKKYEYNFKKYGCTPETIKNFEYARFLVYTPEFHKTFNDHHVALIAITHPLLIADINQHERLANNLIIHIKMFLNLSDDDKQGTYGKFLELMRSDISSLTEIITHHSDIVTQLQNTPLMNFGREMKRYLLHGFEI